MTIRLPGIRAISIATGAALLLGLALTTAPAADAAASPRALVVKPGMGTKGTRSVRVRAVQHALQRRGFRVHRADGRFGRTTRLAVRRFQRRAGLRVDGVVGTKTRRALGLTARFTRVHDRREQARRVAAHRRAVARHRAAVRRRPAPRAGDAGPAPDVARSGGRRPAGGADRRGRHGPSGGEVRRRRVGAQRPARRARPHRRPRDAHRHRDVAAGPPGAAAGGASGARPGRRRDGARGCPGERGGAGRAGRAPVPGGEPRDARRSESGGPRARVRGRRRRRPCARRPAPAAMRPPRRGRSARARRSSPTSTRPRASEAGRRRRSSGRAPGPGGTSIEVVAERGDRRAAERAGLAYAIARIENGDANALVIRDIADLGRRGVGRAALMRRVRSAGAALVTCVPGGTPVIDQRDERPGRAGRGGARRRGAHDLRRRVPGTTPGVPPLSANEARHDDGPRLRHDGEPRRGRTVHHRGRKPYRPSVRRHPPRTASAGPTFTTVGGSRTAPRRRRRPPRRAGDGADFFKRRRSPYRLTTPARAREGGRRRELRG